MASSKVREIILPYRSNIPLTPHVFPEDDLSRAIEKMIQAEVSCMAVLRGRRPIGIVRLQDALKRIGLQITWLER